MPAITTPIMYLGPRSKLHPRGPRHGLGACRRWGGLAGGRGSHLKGGQASGLRAAWGDHGCKATAAPRVEERDIIKFIYLSVCLFYLLIN